MLELKDKVRSDLMRRPNYFSFETPDGGVSLRCFANQCLSAEGATRETFAAITRAAGWPAGPGAAPQGKDPGLLARRSASVPGDSSRSESLQ